ncbi:MAG: lipopolysaccharide assembly protein LapA domain-containing protein [Candidatus Delongbacteria bacterium]
MWFIRWLFTLLLLIYAVIFAALNLDPITLRIPYLPLIDTQPMSKAVVVLLAVALGILIWAVVSFLGSMQFRLRIRQLERQNRDLRLELANLRNKSILEDHSLEGTDAPVTKSDDSGALDLDLPDEDGDDDVFGDVTHVRNSER